MIYSVWNQGAGAFDYYQDDRVQAVLNAEAPTHIASRALGSTVEQAAWPLPADARPIGRGDVPMGRVASRGGQALSGGGDGDLGLVRIGLLLGAFVLARHLLQPRGRR